MGGVVAAGVLMAILGGMGMSEESSKDPTHEADAGVPADGAPTTKSRGSGPELPPPDREELLRVANRDEAALGRFFDHYFAHVFGLVRRLLRDETLAEDATQEVFLKVHRAIERLDPDRDPAPWLTTIAYNVCRDRWRSSADRMDRQSSSIEDQPGLSNRLGDRGPTPEEHSLALERQRLVQEAIARLPEPQREVVVLHDYEGMTHDEIASMVGASHAAIRKRYSRALSALADLLKETLG